MIIVDVGSWFCRVPCNISPGIVFAASNLNLITKNVNELVAEQTAFYTYFYKLHLTFYFSRACPSLPTVCSFNRPPFTVIVWAADILDVAQNVRVFPLLLMLRQPSPSSGRSGEDHHSDYSGCCCVIA